MPKKPSQELIDALKSVIDEFDLDETPVRERQIRIWKKLEYYWAGFTRVWWDDTAHDWRIFDDGFGYDTNGMGYYDKPMNVFRAYLEAIIAALSATVPVIKCSPDDADNTLDVLTARGAEKIADLIYQHNDAQLLWVKALFVYCLQGQTFAFTDTVESKLFGTVDQEEYEDTEEEIELQVCPLCQVDLEVSGGIQSALREMDEFDPGDDDVPLHHLMSEGQIICPNCQKQIDPELQKVKIVIPRFIGTVQNPKSRQKITVLGGLWVKVPNWARCQDEIPYLAYEYETHYTNVYKMYPKISREFHKDNGLLEEYGNQAYERWGRLNPQYYGEYPRSTPTVRLWWLRPSAFHAIPDEKLRDEAFRRFPDGCKYELVNETFAKCSNESLDDHWTAAKNPVSEWITFDPIGMLVTSVQEITQDLQSLTLQTIEHGIPQTFADPTVLDFEQYSKTEVMPGGVYPAKNRGGKNLADGFHMLTTATLSAEVMPFGQQIQSMGQFVSGALPSIYGGQSARGSETASEYSMSRNQALQRLQLTWKFFNVWWKEIFGKVIPAYIKEMKEDERLVSKKDGRFVNSFIRLAELEGKLGEIEIESSDRLPQTWGQIKDTVMQMLEMQNPEIMAAMADPENLGILQSSIGLDGFKIPGETDREKQNSEINQLINSEPLNDGMQEMPSVMPDFDVDNHKIEAEICRTWLVGEYGRLAKLENPAGYKNVLLHMKMHIQMLQALSVPQQTPPMPQGAENANKLKLRPLNEHNEQRNPAGSPGN